MNVLLLGSGGREHAFAMKMAESDRLDQLYIAPGNAGTANFGINVNLNPTDVASVYNFCKEYQIALVVPGNEDPLVAGITDYIELAAAADGLQISVAGPSAWCAQLEGSKDFSKAFMGRHNIPTARYQSFQLSQLDEAAAFLKTLEPPYVLKADGLAAGKGVIICNNHLEAVAEFDMMIHQHKFGDAGKRVVIEEFLNGIEMSVFVLTDGKNYCLLPEAKDYKRIGEGDTGLNTGGMGAVSPVPFADDVFMKKVIDRVVEPTINGFRSENLVYKGFVFIGLIKVNNEPYVIEYNCRMGDPETEVVIPRLKNDLVELLTATANGTIDTVKIEQDPRFAVTMMAVSGGYPGDYIKGYEIEGLDQTVEGSMIFHAGTAAEGDAIVTSGGRVLAVTSMGNEVADCVAQSKNILSGIRFKKMYYRSDIGYEFLNTN